MKRLGVIDARTTLMRRALSIGELEPAIVAVLDDIVDDWRDDPGVVQWWESFGDVRDWIADNGRAPENGDRGAAGLRRWLDGQDGSGLKPVQLHALSTLPQWPTGLTHELWPLIRVLHDRGVVPFRSDDRVVITALCARVDRNIEVEVPDLVPSMEAGVLLSYLMFVARTGRQPGPAEPTGRWIRATRKYRGTSTAVAAVLGMVEGWTGENEVGEVFAARHLRWANAGVRAGHTPRARSANPEERSCAAWASRARRARASGALTAAEGNIVAGLRTVVWA